MQNLQWAAPSVCFIYCFEQKSSFKIQHYLLVNMPSGVKKKNVKLCLISPLAHWMGCEIVSIKARLSSAANQREKKSMRNYEKRQIWPWPYYNATNTYILTTCG